MQKNNLAGEGGFTLVELIVVMAVFIVVIVITSEAFNIALSKTKIVGKSEESNIEGVVGLEMFRHDLEQVGYGLFTETDVTPPSYDEATETYAANFNDAPNGIPRAVVAKDNVNPGDTIALTGTDYLAIKATTVSRSQASQKWTYINGLGTSKIWGLNDFTTGDYVIAMTQSYKNGELSRKLVYDTNNPTSFSVAYKYNSSDYVDPFAPPSDSEKYYYYGIDNSVPRAPFNRTDYMVKRVAGDTLARCAPSAGVLYKATMNQSGTNAGKLNYIPILDCVADMQIVFGWSTTNPAVADVDTYTNADLTTISTSLPWKPSLDDPSDIRKHLKLIKVYILAQDGGFDKNYTNTESAMPVGNSETSLTKTVDLTGTGYQHYRWKLYRIVVRPKNLM
jgi:type II secretory pathway pseudopilin PulG